MKWKKLYAALMCCLSWASVWAQTPTILSRGKADTQEGKDWVESRLANCINIFFVRIVGFMCLFAYFWASNLKIKHYGV